MKDYSKKLLAFLKVNSFILKTNDFNRLYNNAITELTYQNISELTEILLDADINPLNYLTGIFREMYAELSISEITIPDNIIEIDFGAFSNCRSLKNINLSKNLKFIGNCAFYNCDYLTGIVLPKSLEYIADDAFQKCYNLDIIIYEGSEAEWQKLIGSGYYTKHNIEFLNK